MPRKGQVSLRFTHHAERAEMDFENQVALITGSGRGIGRAIALHFAQRGADIVVNFFRNRAPAEETAHEIEKLGRRAVVVKADVGEPEGIEHLFAETERAFGALDILVCNAASGYNRPVMEQRVKGWDWTMNINARSALFCAQKAVPLMQKRGRGYIVNQSSIGSQRVLPDYVVVGASKAALEAVTRYLAIELAPLGLQHWGALLPLILVPALIAELTKWAIRRSEVTRKIAGG